MKRISKKEAISAVLLWAVGVYLLVPLKEWIIFNGKYSTSKFICIVIGILVSIAVHKAFKKRDSIT